MMIYATLIVLLMVTLSFRGISGTMPGGWQPMNVSDNVELLKSLVQFAVNATDKKHEASPYLIVSAQQQVRQSVLRCVDPSRRVVFLNLLFVCWLILCVHLYYCTCRSLRA